MHSKVLTLKPEEADAFMNQHWEEIFILDVRTPMEFEERHLTGAHNISIQVLPEELSRVPKDKTLIIYCTHGIRSRKAAEYLVEKGFSPVYHLEGGMTELLKARTAKSDL